MSCTIIVGGQYGSEAKGKVSLHLARSNPGSTLVFRPGGTNSGHIGTSDTGEQVAFRQLPAAVLDGRVRVALPAGALIDADLLLDEIGKAGLPEDQSRLVIHPDASIILPEHKDAEQELQKRIGSTASGTGKAIEARIMATLGGPVPPLARDIPALAPWLGDTTDAFHEADRAGIPSIIEGTQGSGLSPTFSGNWPKVTSRDTNAANFAAESGVPLGFISRIFVVCRAHPIRVAGPSGDLEHEIDWEEISRGAGRRVEEITTVTRKVRRVARFEAEVVRRAISINRPTDLVLNHLDYIDGNEEITPAKIDYVHEIEAMIGRRVDWLGTSPTGILPRP